MKHLNYCFYKNGIEHEFKYEIDENEVETTLKTIVEDDIEVDETNIDSLFEDLKEEIAILCESKAYAEFEDDYDYRRDLHSYFGVSRAEFVWLRRREKYDKEEERGTDK